MRTLLLAAAVALAPALPVQAAGQAVSDLIAALRLAETVEILHSEGLEYGDSIAEELFPGLSGRSWQATVREIYDAEAMEAALADALTEGLGEAEAAPLAEFFGSQLGKQIVELEISARRALLEPSVDEASREALAEMLDDKDPRLEQVRRYSEANGLVEENVVGALNANFAFYMGLKTGGALPGDMSDSQILADVWSQEEDIRANTEEWVLSYLTMAYRPLSDADLDAYIALSETPEGRALNRALFDGFDEIFVDISRALGEAAARHSAGEEI